MTQEILNTLRRWYESGIERHAMNVRIMVNNPIAIHDHTDFMGAVEAELEKIAEYQDKLEALNFVIGGIANE